MVNLSKEDEQRTKRLHRESVVVDSQVGLVMSFYAEFSQSMFERLNELVGKGTHTPAILCEMDRMHVEESISRKNRNEREWMELSGVDAFNMTVGVYGELPSSYFSYEGAVRDIALWIRKCDCLDYLAKATSVKDIYQAKETGKRAIIVGLQNTDHIGTNLDKLDLFYDLGVRIIQLTYNLMNFVGSGCLERTDAGLSNFGVQVVKRMNELGILIDVSHCGYQTTIDAIKTSRTPLAATHSFCRSLSDHPRGKTDEQLKILANNDGYLGMLVVPFFLAPPGMKASLNDFLDQLEHAIEIMGIDKVGIGSDYGKVVPKPLQSRMRQEAEHLGHMKDDRAGGGATVEGYADHREWPNFTRGLVSRGYTDDEIKGIIGGNFLRVLQEVIG